jgi:branched-chain amino acid transport system substrate-binding protein
MQVRAIVLAVVLVLAPLGARAEILVGIADTFSGATNWGFLVWRSVAVAVAELNEAGGLLGHTIHLARADDACDPEQAVAAARKIAADGAALVIGHACSGAAIPASKIYEAAGILYMAPNASNPRLTDEGGPYVFRLRGRDDRAAALATGNLIERWADERIAIVHDTRVYGQYLAEQVRRRLNEHGIGEALYEEIAPGQLDHTDLVTKLQSARVGVVFFGGYPLEAGLFIRGARQQGATFPLIGGDALGTEEFGSAGGLAAEGTRFLFPPNPMRTNPEAAARFMAKYREMFPVEPNKPASDIEFTSYIALRVWAEAVERAGTLDHGVVSEVLHGQTFDTMLGRLGFDAKGDVTGVELWSWWVWKEGRPVQEE